MFVVGVARNQWESLRDRWEPWPLRFKCLYSVYRVAMAITNHYSGYKEFYTKWITGLIGSKKILKSDNWICGTNSRFLEEKFLQVKVIFHSEIRIFCKELHKIYNFGEFPIPRYCSFIPNSVFIEINDTKEKFKQNSWEGLWLIYEIVLLR